MNNEELLNTPEPSAETQPIAHARYTRAERLRNDAMAPDFSIPEVKSSDMVFKESVTELPMAAVEDMMRNSGIREGVGAQTAAAIENAMIGMNQMVSELQISFGNVANYVTGGRIGDELSQVAYESISNRMAEMELNEEAVGGIRNIWAQLVGGGTSFLQLALEGIATAGYLPLAHIGVQAFGEGTYNDMKAYADEHDGSLVGYEPKGIDLAVNTANTILQVGIEHYLGVGSPRFFTGWSRGLWKEGLSGAAQEALQSAITDLSEVAKGNEDISILLDNADEYLRDAIIGGVLQGGLGAVTYGQKRARSDRIVAKAHALAHGRQTPTKDDMKIAKSINDAKERGYTTAFTNEFKAAFDASTGEGQLQAKIAKALNDAKEKQELDFDVADETELAQHIENIATQETMNAMEMAQEQGKSINEIGLNNVVYKDGAIWLEGTEPVVGEKAVDYAQVLAERQSGYAEAQTKLDNLSREVMELKKELAEAKANNKQAQAEVLQARIDKQNALIQKRTAQAEKLKAQAEKIQAQIAKQQAQAPAKTTAPKMEPVAPKTTEPLAKVAEKIKKRGGEKKSLKAERKAKAETKQQAKEPEQLMLLQSKTKGTGADTYRGGYDERLKRIILNDKSDLTTIQHEFAHYWMQNNFKWARSGLASEDWLRRWRAVEKALGIEEHDRKLSKYASEKFARAYERFIMEGKAAPELQWAFDKFQDYYNEVYDDLKDEYFDLTEELDPAVVDWFNRVQNNTPTKAFERDTKILKDIIVASGGAVVEKTGDTVTMTQMDENGDVNVYTGVPESDIQNGDNMLVYSDKATASKLQQSAQKKFGDDVKVQKLATLDGKATLKNFKDWVARDRAGALAALTDPATNPLYKAYLYKALAEEAIGDAALLTEITGIEMAQEARQWGEAIQALDIRNESGFDVIKIAQNMEKAKGQMTDAEYQQALQEIGLETLELSEADESALENETECKL